MPQKNFCLTSYHLQKHCWVVLGRTFRAFQPGKQESISLWPSRGCQEQPTLCKTFSSCFRILPKGSGERSAVFPKSFPLRSLLVCRGQHLGARGTQLHPSCHRNASYTVGDLSTGSSYLFQRRLKAELVIKLLRNPRSFVCFARSAIR